MAEGQKGGKKLQEKELKAHKCGNRNTNHKLVFEHIKGAETFIEKAVFASICMVPLCRLNYFLHFA